MRQSESNETNPRRIRKATRAKVADKASGRRARHEKADVRLKDESEAGFPVTDSSSSVESCEGLPGLRGAFDKMKRLDKREMRRKLKCYENGRANFQTTAVKKRK